MQPPGAEALAVAGARTHDQCQIARRARLDEALFKRGMQRFGNAALDKAGGRDDVAFADTCDGLIRRNDFVCEHALRFPEWPALDFSGT